MAIRAVDMAMPVQRATEMTQSQRGEQRPEVQHQQFAARLAREALQQETSVQQTPQSEEAQIQKDGRGNTGGGGGRGKKKGKKEEGTKPAQRARDSMFDMSV